MLLLIQLTVRKFIHVLFSNEHSDSNRLSSTYRHLVLASFSSSFRFCFSFSFIFDSFFFFISFFFSSLRNLLHFLHAHERVYTVPYLRGHLYEPKFKAWMNIHTYTHIWTLRSNIRCMRVVNEDVFVEEKNS